MHLFFCRDRLEILTRRLVLAYTGSQIEVVRGTVVGIHASPDGTRIESITWRPSIKDTVVGVSTATSVETIETSLFVDCSGPSTISAKALPAAEVGWGPFRRYHYNPNVSYRTALVTVPEIVREAISRSVPKEDIDYGRWDRMGLIHVLTPTPETGRELYVVQKVDGDRRALFALFQLSMMS